MENLSLFQIVIMGMGSIYLVVWMILFFISMSNENMFFNLDEKEYPLKEVYFVGYGILQLTHYSYRSERDKKIKQELGILFEERYADYYLRVIWAQRLTYASLLIALAFVFYGLTAEPIMFVIFLLFAGVAFYYSADAIHQKIAKRSQELLGDFSEVVSELALLINTGMVMRDAWQIAANNGRGMIHQEMQRVVAEIQNGRTEREAYTQFGTRCVIPEVKKFTSTILQGMTKGNRELGQMLREQNEEIWKEKKQSVEMVAQQAATKLLIPMCIMFAGIIILIVVPIFTNLGM